MNAGRPGEMDGLGLILPQALAASRCRSAAGGARGDHGGDDTATGAVGEVGWAGYGGFGPEAR